MHHLRREKGIFAGEKNGLAKLFRRQVPTLSFANNPQDAADLVKVFFIVELGFFRVELV